jgi:hypothetical protein
MARSTKSSATNWTRKSGSSGRKVPYLSVVTQSTVEPAVADSAYSDLALALVAFMVGALIVVAAVVRHAPWGAGATVGLLLCVLSGRALVVELVMSLRARRLGGRR